MSRPLVVAVRDVRAMFGSAFGYGLTAGFLALSGVLLVFALRAGEARLDDWFASLFLVVGVLASLLTMRVFAEEERSGSIELLLSAPVHLWQIVLGKLLGSVLTFSVIVAGTVVAPLLVASLGDPDLGPIITGYIGLLLLGTAFLSVGMAASSATSSQLVASATSVGILLALWFGEAVSSSLDGATRVVLDYLSPSTHVIGFLRGTVALVDVTYFLSMTALGAVATVLIVRGRR